MTQSEYGFMLNDRLQKIQQIAEEYDLEKKAYVSFSGGKDSCVLSDMLDKALPGNKIPRVYVNTGLEYVKMVEYVRERARADSRIIEIRPKISVKRMLETEGYPFKSKEHALKLSVYQHSGKTKTVADYIGEGKKSGFLCPRKLLYQFSGAFKLRVSNRCCYRLKKEPCEKWSEENKRRIAITGIRADEGGFRNSLKSCLVFAQNPEPSLRKFHPLLPVAESFISSYIEREKIKLCGLYGKPYFFKRTGCVGCPFALDLSEQLEKMRSTMPCERQKAEIIWEPVYKEYRRIGYRLMPEQMNLNF